MENSETKKVLIVKVGCALFIIFTLWIGFKMLANGFSTFIL